MEAIVSSFALTMRTVQERRMVAVSQEETTRTGPRGLGFWDPGSLQSTCLVESRATKAGVS